MDQEERTQALIVEADRDADQFPATQAQHYPASPLDQPVAAFRAGLDRRGANRQALIEWVRGALVEGVDYGRIQTKRGLSKPSLYKPGAEKICGMLGVTAVFPSLRQYEQLVMEGQALDMLLLRCELLNGNGEVVASGAGARSVAQDQGDLNKALKMCLKSAMIDATLRLGGLSEVFTQDIEDMPAGTIAQPEPPAAARAPSGPWDGQEVVTFGKHAGKRWAEVPDDYLQWGTMKLGGDKQRSCELELERRALTAQADDDARAGEGEEDFDDDLPF